MRTLGSYSLSNFKKYHTIVSTVIIMYYIYPQYLLITEIFYLMATFI